MRRVLVVALCSMLLLSGCSLPTDGGSSTPGDATGTESASPTSGSDGTASGDDAARGERTGTASGSGTDTPGVPDGFDLSGIGTEDVNETLFLGTHLETLNQSSVRVEVRETGADGSVTRSVVYRNESTSLSRDFGVLPSVTWRRGNVSSSRREFGEGPTYRSTFDATGSLSFGSDSLNVFAVSIYFTSGDYRVVGTVDRDGEELLRLRAERPSDTGFGPAYAVYEGTALVDRRGLLRSLQGQFAVDTSETPTRFNYTVTPTDRIPRPDWLDAVPRFRGDLVADDRVVAITHVGGRQIPVDTSVTVDTDVTEFPVQATTSQAISPGETVYVALVAANESAILRRNRPSPSGLADLGESHTRVEFSVSGPSDATEPTDVRVAVGENVFATVGEDDDQ